jgi:hypothetical protein
VHALVQATSVVHMRYDTAYTYAQSCHAYCYYYSFCTACGESVAAMWCANSREEQLRKQQLQEQLHEPLPGVTSAEELFMMGEDVRSCMGIQLCYVHQVSLQALCVQPVRQCISTLYKCILVTHGLIISALCRQISAVTCVHKASQILNIAKIALRHSVMLTFNH